MRKAHITIAVVSIILIGVVIVAYALFASVTGTEALSYKKILVASDLPPGNATQGSYGRIPTSWGSLDTTTSMIVVNWSNYKVMIEIELIHFPSQEKANNSFQQNVESFNTDNGQWAQVEIDAGDGCTYYHSFNQGDYNYPPKPDSKSYLVMLYKNSLYARMEITYDSLKEGGYFDQSYIEYIIELQAEKLA